MSRLDQTKNHSAIEQKSRHPAAQTAALQRQVLRESVSEERRDLFPRPPHAFTALIANFTGSIDVTSAREFAPVVFPPSAEPNSPQAVPVPHAHFAPSVNPPSPNVSHAAQNSPTSSLQQPPAAQRGNKSQSLGIHERHWFQHDPHPRATINVGQLEHPNNHEKNRQFSPVESPAEAIESSSDQIAGKIAAANQPLAKGITAAPHAPFLAAYEVEQFAWLPLIENLSAQQAVGFAAIACELQVELNAGRNVIAVTSRRRGEGRTTLVQCLARAVANTGLRVCLVDADCEQPKLAEQLGLAIDAGWDAVTAGGKRIDEICVESTHDGITAALLKAPCISWKEGDLAASPVWLDRLRAEFDLVLLDVPPIDTQSNVNSAADGKDRTAALALTAWKIDGWLVARDVRVTAPADLARWQQVVRLLGLNLLGILENRTVSAAPPVHARQA